MSVVSRPRPARCHNNSSAAGHTSFRALVSAEFHRARQTRSTFVLISIMVGIALIMLIIRAVLSIDSDMLFGSEVVTLSADIVGFAMFLVIAIMVAKDHQTGTVDLLRSLTPVRSRHLAARATGTGLLALMAIGIVVLAGFLAVLALNSAAVDLELVDTIARTATTTFLLAWTGVGVGALTRSPAAATFVVIALYWLLPIALIIAGLTGTAWATSLSDVTLGILAANAIVPGPHHWAATGGIALWSAILIILGTFRETKGK